MPVYNGQKYIKESVDSVLAQDYTCWELIVVDDGSTDKTPEILQEFATTDVRIKVISQENRGQSNARNMAIESSKGELITFLDSDDYWLPHRLSLMEREFIRGDQDLLFADSYILEEGVFEKDCEKLKCFGVKSNSYSGTKGLEEFLDINLIPILTVMMRANVAKHFLFDESISMAEDYDLWLRLLVAGFKLRSVGCKVAVYRIHSGSTSAKDRACVDSVLSILARLGESSNDCNVQTLIRAKAGVWYFRKVKQLSCFEELERFLESYSNANGEETPKVYVILNLISKYLFRITKHYVANHLLRVHLKSLPTRLIRSQ
jgi:teichuronic acid biosynthesis glycosyltransferase TuaG